MLAQTLKPLADAGASLQVVMAYRFPGEPTRGAIELSPVSGKKPQVAAQTAGLDRSSIPTILVMGDDRPGLGSQIAEAIAGSGINISFMVVQVVGRRYSAVYGFETEEEAQIAANLIKKVSKPRRR
jgi:predicted amino acid-binding ACT domain protein